MNKRVRPAQRRVDVFKCIECAKHLPGTELGSSTEYPFATPPRLEFRCKHCEWVKSDVFSIGEDISGEVKDLTL